MAKKIKNSKKDNKEVIRGIGNEKLCSILSYLIIGLIWYLVDVKIRTEKTRFHVKQGLILLIAELINSAIWGIPLVGWVIGPIINVGLIILIIIGIVNALNDEEKVLPVLGKFSEKFDF